MPLTRLFAHERRGSLRKVATRILIISTLAALATCVLFAPAHPVHASGSLPQGRVINVRAASCTFGTTLPGMTCNTASVTGCANAADLNFTYGYIVPSAPVRGLVIYFEGGGGTTAVSEEGEFNTLTYYYSSHYAVVEIAWGTSWQATWDPYAMYSGPPPANIQYGACRPATFLQFIHDGLYATILQNPLNSTAGMCAQGFSMGSAAVAYSLAYYGADALLDHAELISGPPASDIKWGCQAPTAPPTVTVCGTGDSWCKLGGDTPWTLSPRYPTYDANALGTWTGSTWTSSTIAGVPCAGSVDTSGWNATWKAQSIVDASPGATPLFSYPLTGITGWLCRTVVGGAANATSPQGELFYDQLIPSTPPFSVYSVDSCQGPEGVVTTTTSVPGFVGASDGQTAVKYDMAGGSGNIPAANCTKRHN